MSWGTTIKEVYISRMSKESAESGLKDELSLMQMLRDELMILAAATPREIKDEDGTEQWEDYIRRRVAEIYDSISESAVKCYQYQLLIDADPSDLVSE